MKSIQAQFQKDPQEIKVKAGAKQEDWAGVCRRFNDDVELELKDTYAVLYDGRKTGHYHFADRSMVKIPPKKSIDLPSVDIEFTVKADDFENIVRDAAVLNLPEIAVIGEEGNVFLSAVNVGQPGQGSSNNDLSKLNIGETDKTFMIVFKIENLKLMPRDYEVKASSAHISHWKSEDIQYWVAAERSSNFGQ